MFLQQVAISLHRGTMLTLRFGSQLEYDAKHDCLKLLSTTFHNGIAVLLYSYAWGALSDVFGYKPILVVSNVLLALASAIFGLSVNFPMAIATRFLVGLVNGKNVRWTNWRNFTIFCDSPCAILGNAIVENPHRISVHKVQ